MERLINFHAVSDLPKLAWLTSLDLVQGTINVLHGSAVECREAWLAEGVWDGDFAGGDFHRSENFFGSGIRVEGGRVYFVPSSALVDGLVYCIHDGVMFVSNSMILLLASTGASLDSAHPYSKEANAILKGISAYDKRYPVVHPEIDQFCRVFHENVVVENGEVTFESRTKAHPVGSFEEYITIVTETLGRIRDNYQSPDRKVALDAFTTLSSGYDSTAVSALVRRIGVRKCFASKRSSSAMPRWINRAFALDDGRPIAKLLNLEVIDLDQRGSAIGEDELYFYVVDPSKAELAFCAMASHIQRYCSAAVVFTGYHGDRMWDANLRREYINPEIIRGDISGLRLSEIRLRSGFINAPVPFILARSVEGIVKITESPAMDPWRLGNSYDRPIPRRIAEAAGVTRELFGMRKKVVSGTAAYPIDPNLRRQFFVFLRKQSRIHPRLVYAQRMLTRFVYFFFRCLAYVQYLARSRRLSLPPLTSATLKSRSIAIGKDVDVSRYLFLWSVDVLTRKTAAILQRAEIDTWRSPRAKHRAPAQS